jgi:UDP-glucose 4-epimerase
VGISTDKACKPVNVMGLTKAIQERIFLSANVLNAPTRFICVRYGNVLASRGSVIPLFHDQIKNGGPVTITTREMTRFLLSIDQAVDTVFAAIKDAEPGEIYVPRAPAASVLNIAKALIGNRNIDIKVTGIRPGEKIHEIMVSEEEVGRCVFRGEWFGIKPMLPELESQRHSEPANLLKEYSSGDEVLNYDSTVELLKKHRLLIEDQPDFTQTKVELLR